MRTRGIGKDRALTFRMGFTMLMLALVYVAFFGLLFSVGVHFIVILVMGFMMGIFQFFMSHRLVLMTTGAKIVTPQEEPKIHAMIERLAASADLPMPKVAMMETHVPNAFATGRNQKNSVVAVTRGLMSRLDDRELEAVLAHELSHIKHRDVMVITLASLIVIASGYLMQMMFWMSLFGGFGGGYGGRRHGGGQAMAMMMLVYVGTIVVYFVSQLLIMALTRYRELAADRGSATLTGAPSQLASALMKINGEVGRIPEKDLRRVEHANAFFIVPALKGSSMASLFSSHPPVEKRIERLRQMQRQMEGGR